MHGSIYIEFILYNKVISFEFYYLGEYME